MSNGPERGLAAQSQFHVSAQLMLRIFAGREAHHGMCLPRGRPAHRKVASAPRGRRMRGRAPRHFTSAPGGRCHRVGRTQVGRRCHSLVAAIMAMLICLTVPARGQTTRPTTQPTHEERVAEAAKTPLVTVPYKSSDGKSLTEAQLKEIEACQGLLAQAVQARQKVDYAAAARDAIMARDKRRSILGSQHHETITAAIEAATMTRFTSASDADRQRLTEADALIQRADDDLEQGRYSEAVASAKGALETFERILGEDHADVGRGLRILGAAQTELEAHGVAEASLTRALAVTEGARGRYHPQTALVLDRLGWLHLNKAFREGYDVKKINRAAEHLRLAVSIFNATVGETAETAEALDNLGTVQVYTREPRRALAAKLRSLVIRRTLLGPEHKDTAVSLSNIAWLYERLGVNDEEVIPLRRQALAAFNAAIGPDHPYTVTEEMNLAEAYLRRDRADDAILLLEKCVSRDASQSGKLDAGLVGRKVKLGVAYLDAGRQADAIQVLRQAFDQAVSLHDQGEVESATAHLDRLATAYQRRRMLDDAIAAFERICAWDRQGTGSSKDVVSRRLLKLGTLYLENGRFQDADRVLTEALQKAKKVHGEQALEAFPMLLRLSRVHRRLGELAEAERYCEEALRVAETHRKHASTQGGLAMHQMGCVHTLQKRFGMAKFALEDAKEIIEKQTRSNPAALIRIGRDLALLHVEAGRQAEGLGLLQEALRQTRDFVGDSKNPYSRALLAKSIKFLADALEAGGPSAKEERDSLNVELKAILEHLEADRALDADNRQWLETLK